MRTLTLIFLGIASFQFGRAQLFTLRNPYTGGHQAFTHFDPDGLNQFVVQFNLMYANDLKTGFSQYKGSELGQTFSTSGLRFVWGKKKVQWTASSDASFGIGKKRNTATFKNGLEQNLFLRYTSSQVNVTFGVALKENRYWLEALYCTNLGKIYLEYSTVHLNGVESFGPEYRLNGVYEGTIKTQELGLQASMRFGKRFVLYTRAFYPIAITGPKADERYFTDARTTRDEPNNFPSNYDNYVQDPVTYANEHQGLNSGNFKGLSYGFGLLMMLGKTERKPKS
ncbi:MAG: hypothetical protein H6581_16620 [Bacteroidia bacterium]|nr:hypothetical protein [Bacteroidia bacterium]